MYKIILSIGILFFFLIAKPVFANDGKFLFTNTDILNAKTTLNFAKKDDWNSALKHAGTIKDPTVKKLVLWMKYRKTNNYTFQEISQFIRINKNWPEIDLLKRKAEEAINNKISNQEILRWFRTFYPITAKGKLHFAQAILKKEKKIEKDAEIANKLIRNAWTTIALSKEEEIAFLKKYKKILTSKDYINRVDYLLSQNQISQARRIMGNIPNNYVKLFNARIELMQNINMPKILIKHVPNKLKEDPGLLFHAAEIYYKQSKNNIAQNLLMHPIQSPHYSSKLWKLRIKYIREAIQEKKYKTAYDLAKTNHLLNKEDYAESEWLSGWLALRFLNNPHEAYKHFYNLYKKTNFALSKSRGAYWAGRAAEASNNSKIANDWYRTASHYPHTFYGQLSLLKLNSRAHLILPNPDKLTKQDIDKYKNKSIIKASYLLAKTQNYETAKKFIKSSIMHSKDAKEISFISSIGAIINKADLSVFASKESARKNIILSKLGYPYIKDVEQPNIDKNFALAIIRQESMFDKNAVSSAGARGMMQLMPNTAMETAKSMKLRYSKNRLFDANYNIKLGCAYLSKLIKIYKGSYILAIAAYNAGEHHVNRWINEQGDPRKLTKVEDVIDWIESIPFYETRNYVQRVLENLQNYKAINSANYRLQLIKDLKRKT